MYVCRNCKKIAMYRVNGLCEECAGKPTKRAADWLKAGGLARMKYRKVKLCVPAASR